MWPAHVVVSDLTLTVLTAVAEFERAMIVERTLDGLAVARRAGKKARSASRQERPSTRARRRLRAAG